MNSQLSAEFTNRQQAEQVAQQALVEKEQANTKFKFLENEIDAIQVAIVMFDSDLQISGLNNVAAQMLGFAKYDILNESLSKFLVDKDAQRFRYLAKSFINTQNKVLLEKEREIKILYRGTQCITASMRVSPVVNESNHAQSSFAATIVDISAQKQLTRIYEEQATAALNASLSKSMFLAKMSHEIRTPLNGVLGSMQLIERLEDPEKQKKLLKTAIRSGENLASIVNDILDLSKIESNSMSYEKIPFSIREILSRIMNEVRGVAEVNNVKISCTFSEAFSNNLLGDPTRIGQVIMNLMSNAVKFTKNGEVSLHLATDTSDHDTHTLTIAVKDTGIGISRLAMKTLFEPFTQADNSMSRRYGGSGLGLTISRSICQQLGGDLSCASKIGQGSTFTALIPIELSDQESTTSHTQVEKPLPDLSRLRILMVEDNDINAEILQAMLEQTGCVVTRARDGQDGIEKYYTFEPDIILMDIQMPRIDGLTACKILREQGCATPILAVTANIMNDEIQHYHENGFNGHVPKPILQNALLESLANAMPNTVH